MPLYAQSDAAARRRLAYAPVEVPRAAVPARASRNAHVQPARRAGASPTRAVVRESRLHEALAVREDPAVLRTPLRMYVRDAAQAGSKASPERLSPASSSDVFNRRSMGEAAGDDVDELPDSRVTVIDRSAVNLQPPPVSIETMAALVPSAPPPRVVDAADVQTHQARAVGHVRMAPPALISRRRVAEPERPALRAEVPARRPMITQQTLDALQGIDLGSTAATVGQSTVSALARAPLDRSEELLQQEMAAEAAAAAAASAAASPAPAASDEGDLESRVEAELRAVTGNARIVLKNSEQEKDQSASVWRKAAAAQQRDRYAELFRHARHNRAKEMTEMFDDGAEPDLRDEHGNTALHIACQNGHKRAVKACLRRGADINIQNNTGQTALHFCYEYGYDELAEYLKAKGADDTVRNMFGLTCYNGLRPSMEETEPDSNAQTE